jgi:hypothetical protein
MVVCALCAIIDVSVIVCSEELGARKGRPSLLSLNFHPRYVRREIFSEHKSEGESKDRKKNEGIAFEQVISTRIKFPFSKEAKVDETQIVSSIHPSERPPTIRASFFSSSLHYKYNILQEVGRC